MVNYIVGYGVKATMDDAANRATINARAGTGMASVGTPPEECRIVDLIRIRSTRRSADAGRSILLCVPYPATAIAPTTRFVLRWRQRAIFMRRPARNSCDKY